MPRFFCSQIEGDQAVIAGEDARHLIKSLRVRQGERLTLCDARGSDYLCAVSEIADGAVLLQVLERVPNETEPQLSVTLYQALPKGDKLEFIIQKAVEMGAVRIVPVQTRFCVARTDPATFERKRERYEKIALEAAKQCGRGIIPEVGGILSFQEAVTQMSNCPSIVFYEGGGRPVRELISPDQQTLSVLIGSEGGLSLEEISACRQAGIRPASLGKRILRCETAPIAAMAVILAAAGEL